MCRDHYSVGVNSYRKAWRNRGWLPSQRIFRQARTGNRAPLRLSRQHRVDSFMALPPMRAAVSSRIKKSRDQRFYCPVHMLGTKRLHNASFPSGRTRELCLDFFAAVATLNSRRDANLWGRGSMFEQRRGS